MPAYFVAENEITNETGFAPYRAAVNATLEQYGGCFLTRGGATELIEGGPEPKRVIILEFADTAAVKRQLARIPENPPHAARQLDRPRLHRRRRELAVMDLSGAIAAVRFWARHAVKIGVPDAAF
jgi:uncharacterized protein (DUF1330 family)